GRDGLRDQLRIDISCVGLDVHEYRAGASMDDGVRRRAKRHRRRDDFVARPHAGDEHRQVQGGGARAHRDGFGGSDVSLELVLEARDSWSRPYPAGSQRRDDFIDLFRLDQRTPEYEEILSHWRSLFGPVVVTSG